MTREIKFRGKHNVFDSFSYGHLLVINDNYHIIEYGDMDEDGHHIVQVGDSLTWVHKDTVSQYTGLKDSKGVEIYEGDIVRNINKNSFAYNEVSEVSWHNGISSFVCLFENIGQSKCLGTYESLIVIGNIYDNKELLNI